MAQDLRQTLPRRTRGRPGIYSFPPEEIQASHDLSGRLMTLCLRTCGTAPAPGAVSRYMSVAEVGAVAGLAI